MRIVKVLEASTANVTQETAAKLDTYETANWRERPNVPVTHKKGEYGWWVYVPDIHPITLPPELKALVDYARAQDCTWIMFDRDADPLEGFPVFDW